MERIKVTNRGFYGCYWPKPGARCAMIGMFGDDTEDFMAKSVVKWFQTNFNLNVLTMSPGKKDYSHHNYPLERFGEAIRYLYEMGNEKIAVSGASTTGMLALIAASYYPEITLTIAMTPSDFVMEGFYQGKRDGQTEWPGEGESTVSYEGKPLPYLPFCYRHPEYGRKMKEEAKTTRNAIASSWVFRDSEDAHPLREEEFIKVERIKGKILLFGAEDDVLWDTAKYIRRMEERLSRLPHDSVLEAYVYPIGTHFVFPEGIVKGMLPLGGDLLSRMFLSGRKYPKECKATRVDVEEKMTTAIHRWIHPVYF